jgi:hypothetical protein
MKIAPVQPQPTKLDESIAKYGPAQIPQPAKPQKPMSKAKRGRKQPPPIAPPAVEPITYADAEFASWVEPSPGYTGKPILMTPEMQDEICSLVATGMNLKDISRMPDMPCYKTILRKRLWDDVFSRAYEHACVERAESWIDEMHALASDPSRNPAQVRNLISVIQWTASKLKSDKYGDKLDVKVQSRVQVIDYSRIPVEDLEAIEGILLENDAVALEGPSRHTDGGRGLGG